MAERKIQLPIDGDASKEAPAPMDLEQKSSAPMEVEGPHEPLPAIEISSPQKGVSQSSKKEIKTRKRIFAASLCEKILDFKRAVDNGVTECTADFLKNCDELMKSENPSPAEIRVLSQDLLNILRTVYANALQLQTCVYHQYNYERSTQPVDANLQKIEPEFTLVGNVTQIRNNLALLIQGYTQFIANSDIKESYSLKLDKKSLPILRKFAVNAQSDCVTIANIAIVRAYDMCKTILPARFLIEDEKTRASKMMDALIKAFPSLFVVSEDGKSVEYKESVPRWQPAVEEPPRPVGAFRKPIIGGAKAIAEAKGADSQKRKNAFQLSPGARPSGLIGRKKEAKKS